MSSESMLSVLISEIRVPHGVDIRNSRALVGLSSEIQKLSGLTSEIRSRDKSENPRVPSSQLLIFFFFDIVLKLARIWS